jgi:hypothetical protein
MWKKSGEEKREKKRTKKKKKKRNQISPSDMIPQVCFAAQQELKKKLQSSLRKSKLGSSKTEKKWKKKFFCFLSGLLEMMDPKIAVAGEDITRVERIGECCGLFFSEILHFLFFSPLHPL